MTSQARPWHQSLAVLLLSAVALPPAGLVLLWMRRGMKAIWKLLGTIPILGFAVAHLFLFFGLRVEMDGTGAKPMFSFGTREARYKKLEASRAAPPPATVQAAPATAPSAPVAPPYWTDFCGPNRDGHYDETPILTVWPKRGLARLWKQPAGGGYASFVVAEGRAFTIEQRRNREVVAAYDIDTGRELWTNSWAANFQESMGGDGPRATPTWHDGRLYAQGAEGELRCLEAATGKLVWSKNILADNGASNITWGMSASPLIVDEKVIVQPGGTGGTSVVAYHKLTGAAIWKVLDDKQAYTSPVLVTLGGRRQVITATASRAVGLAPEAGALLWEYPWVTEYGVNAAQPIVTGPNRFFISAGYGHGSAVVELQPAGATFTARTVWQNTRMKSRFNPPVLYAGHVYGLDEGILVCLDVETGEQKWKGGRYGYGQLLLAGGHLVLTTETGEVVLVKATPERHQELARFSALDGKTWNVPALAGGRLFVRNATEMACFRIAP
ncbi:MAG: PQQ-binding-like beta-propeller repeat protein [Acidobacteria bacterium]|nr:PQQ-binding-like beta-propeller repeat protein [Acidobacteriota bacterium]